MAPLIARQTLTTLPLAIPSAVRGAGVRSLAVLVAGFNGTLSRNEKVRRLSVQGIAELATWSLRGSRRETECGNRDGGDAGGGCFDDAVALLSSAPALPQLVVLDLDFTVWPFYCYSRSKSPGRSRLPVYPQAVDIVRALAAQNVKMAIASRSPAASFAKAILDQHSIGKHFDVLEIYFTVYSKNAHFAALREKTGVPYSAMLFFDDERKNINVASKLGVCSVLVTEGLDVKSLKLGLNMFTAAAL